MKHVTATAVRGQRRQSWKPSFASLSCFLLAAVVYGSVFIEDIRPPKQRRSLFMGGPQDVQTLNEKVHPKHCSLCGALNTTTTDPSQPNNRYKSGSINVAMLMTSRHDPELMVLAAGLLSENISVTVISLNDQKTTAHISSRILSHVHCQKQQEAHDMLLAKSVEVRANLNAKQPVAVDNLEAQIQGVQAVLQSSKNSVYPRVLIVESRALGGMFVAESFGIPIIVVANQFTMIEAGLVVNHKYYETWSKLWQKILRIPWTYYENISSTWLFAKISQRRRALGLDARRSLSDIWKSATGILVIPVFPFRSLYWRLPGGYRPDRYPKILDIYGPLISPAIPCTPKFRIDTFGAPVGFVGIVVPPPDLSIMHRREIIRGLSLAKASLDSYRGTCGNSKSPVCWNGPTDLKILWLETANTTVPNIFPSFIKTLHASVHQDILFQSLHVNSTKALFSIVDCDAFGQSSMALRLPVLCLFKENPRIEPYWFEKERERIVEYIPKIDKNELATELLRLLPRVNPTSQKKSAQTEYDVQKSLGSLRHAVQYVKKAGLLPQQNKAELKGATGVDLSRKIQYYYKSFPGQKMKENHGHQSKLCSFLLFLAGVIIVAGTVYLVATQLFATHTRSLWGQRFLRNHPRFSILENLIFRISEMDQAFDDITRWWQEASNGGGEHPAKENKHPTHNGRATNHTANGKLLRKKHS